MILETIVFKSDMKIDLEQVLSYELDRFILG